MRNNLCEKRLVGFYGEILSNFPHTLCYYFGYNLAHQPPNLITLVFKEIEDPWLHFPTRDLDRIHVLRPLKLSLKLSE